jgi:hypothetical protein
MIEPYDTLAAGCRKLFAECLSLTLTEGICIPRFWALYLTQPSTIFKATSVSCVAMSVLEYVSTIYDYSNVSCHGADILGILAGSE